MSVGTAFDADTRALTSDDYPDASTHLDRFPIGTLHCVHATPREPRGRDTYMTKTDSLLSNCIASIISAMTNLHDLRLAVSSMLVLSARKWRRTSDGVLNAYGVSEACAAPLLMVGRLGEAVRQGTLAEHVGIEGPSLVRLLDQLCAAGLARRDEDPGDRRAKTISLTDAGRAVTAQMEADLKVLRARVLKGITRAELETTLRVLDAFNAPGEAAPRHAPGSAP